MEKTVIDIRAIRDHIRYIKHAEERKKKQREYYSLNRERILKWHRDYRIRMQEERIRLDKEKNNR